MEAFVLKCVQVSFHFNHNLVICFLVNGKLILVNGKPFRNLTHISCGFLKYASWIFKVTQVQVYKLCIKTT